MKQKLQFVKKIRGIKKAIEEQPMSTVINLVKDYKQEQNEYDKAKAVDPNTNKDDHLAAFMPHCFITDKKVKLLDSNGNYQHKRWKPTGIAHIDLDGIAKDQRAKTRKKILDAQPLALYVSPSKDGLKAFWSYTYSPENEQFLKENFITVQRHMMKHLLKDNHIKLDYYDPSVYNPNRQCYISYDPKAIYDDENCHTLDADVSINWLRDAQQEITDLQKDLEAIPVENVVNLPNSVTFNETKPTKTLQKQAAASRSGYTGIYKVAISSACNGLSITEAEQLIQNNWPTGWNKKYLQPRLQQGYDYAQVDPNKGMAKTTKKSYSIYSEENTLIVTRIKNRIVTIETEINNLKNKRDDNVEILPQENQMYLNMVHTNKQKAKNTIELGKDSKGKPKKLSTVIKKHIKGQARIRHISSETGSGKTFWFCNVAEGKRMMIAPLRGIVEQAESEENDVQLWYGYEKFPTGSEVIVATYDKLKNITDLIKDGTIKDKEYDLYIDEVDNMYTEYAYRAEAIDNVILHLRYFKNIYLMSGTTNMSILSQFLKVDKELNFKSYKTTAPKCNLVFSANALQYVKDLCKTMEKGEKTLIWYDNKEQLNQLNDIMEADDYNVMVYTSDNQNDDDIQSFLIEQKIPENVDIVAMTKVGLRGINLLNEDIKHIISYEHTATDELVQVHNRARRADPTLHVIRPLKQENFNVRDIDSLSLRETINAEIDVINCAFDAKMKQYAKSKNKDHRNLHPDTIAARELSACRHMKEEVKLSIKYSPARKVFYFNNVGFAHYLYLVHKRNEYTNLDYFEEVMTNGHGYDVDYIIHEDGKDEEKLLSGAKEKRIAIKNAILETYPTETDLVSYLLRDEKDHDEHKTILDVEKLLNFFDYDQVFGIYEDGLLNKMLGICKREIKGDPLTDVLRHHLKIGCTYTYDDLLTFIDEQATPFLYPNRKNHGSLFEGKKMSTTLKEIFEIKQTRGDNKSGQKRTTNYMIVSHNPYGISRRTTVYGNANVNLPNTIHPTLTTKADLNSLKKIKPSKK